MSLCIYYVYLSQYVYYHSLEVMWNIQEVNNAGFAITINGNKVLGKCDVWSVKSRFHILYTLCILGRYQRLGFGASYMG